LLSDAPLALDERRRRGLGGGMTLDELDLAGLALAPAGVRELVRKLDAMVAPLRGRSARTSTSLVAAAALAESSQKPTAKQIAATLDAAGVRSPILFIG
jgi:hypothetical protein